MQISIYQKVIQTHIWVYITMPIIHLINLIKQIFLPIYIAFNLILIVILILWK